VIRCVARHQDIVEVNHHHLPIRPCSRVFIPRWNSAGALVSPNGTTRHCTARGASRTLSCAILGAPYR
jgi:hypothetical protein